MSIHDYLYVTQDHRRFYENLPLNTATDLYDRDAGIYPDWLNASMVEDGILPHTESHCHEDFELLYFIEGRSVLRVNNERYETEPGDVFIINPFDMHSIEVPADQPRFSRMVLIFDPELLYDSRYPSSFDYIGLLKSEMLKYSHTVSRGGEDEEFLRSMMTTLYEAFLEMSDAGMSVIKGCLYLIFGRLIKLNHTGSGDSVRSVEQNEFTAKVYEYIKENYARQISTEDAAVAMAYNKSYFCRRFRKYFNRSFTEYLNIYRIYRAKCLMISDRDIKVSRLSSSVGFSTPAFFTHTFKKYTGVLPSGYLRHISETDPEQTRPSSAVPSACRINYS